MPRLREISVEQWTLAVSCVTGCQGVAWYVPTLDLLDKTIKELAAHIGEIRRTRKDIQLLPGWLVDLDLLIDRRVYMTMLPPEGMPVDGHE